MNYSNKDYIEHLRRKYPPGTRLQLGCIFSKKDETFSPLDYCDEPCFSGGNISEHCLKGIA